jgi:6,7-dimethyl-8-ribityllumazine synthase
VQSIVNLGLVVADFNSEITRKMSEQAVKRARELGAQVTYVCRVPGSFDMPIIIQDLLEKKDVDAVATLGAIVKGETAHDEVIAATLSDQISALSVKFRKPVALGVSGPRESWVQAESRAEEYADRSVEAAITLVRVRCSLVKREDARYPVLAE